MEFTEKALILQVGQFREADLWLKLLTPTRGVFTAFAFGGKKSRRRFVGCLEPLSEAEFHVRQSNRHGYHQLAEGRLLESFCGLRADPSRLGMAVNCLRFAGRLQAGPEKAAAIFTLLRGTLSVLAEAPRVPHELPILFRARMLLEQGFGPHLASCLSCGAEVDHMPSPRFSLKSGGIVCSGCAGDTGFCLPASRGTIRTLDFVAGEPPARWAKLALDPDIRRECYDIIDAFIEYHLGLDRATERSAPAWSS